MHKTKNLKNKVPAPIVKISLESNQVCWGLESYISKSEANLNPFQSYTHCMMLLYGKL